MARLTQLNLYEARPTQTAAILADLEAGRSVTPLDALDRHGCMRLAARIADLKRKGHPIVTTRRYSPDGKSYAAYLLVDRP